MQHDLGRMGDLINIFWTEFENFQSKLGPYENREYIFINHVDIINGKSYLWHKKETLRYTKIFGKFACRVCSKILGIGSAERSWGDVKSLKNNKRSHLSADRVKKQTTIFGASCIEQARFQRQKDSTDVSSSPLKFWRDDDFYNSDGENEEVEKPKRIFKAFIEDWEEDAIKKRDIVNKTKLISKYGGLTWKDPDHGNMVLRSSTTMLKWTRVTKHGGGYCVMAHSPEYNENDEEDPENNTEPWYINDDLIYCIEEYYTQNKNEGVLVISNKKKDDDENENDANEIDDDDGSSTISTSK